MLVARLDKNNNIIMWYEEGKWKNVSVIYEQEEATNKNL